MNLSYLSIMFTRSVYQPLSPHEPVVSSATFAALWHFSDLISNEKKRVCHCKQYKFNLQMKLATVWGDGSVEFMPKESNKQKRIAKSSLYLHFSIKYCKDKKKHFQIHDELKVKFEHPIQFSVNYTRLHVNLFVFHSVQKKTIYELFFLIKGLLNEMRDEVIKRIKIVVCYLLLTCLILKLVK